MADLFEPWFARTTVGRSALVLVTVDGAGARRELVEHLSTLNAAPGGRVPYSVGFDPDDRVRR
jgi:hypothetical protein